MAIKNHFQTTYDYFRYNGKVKTQPSSFEVRKDKYFFTKMQKHPDALGLLVSHFIDNPHAWIGDIVQFDVSQDLYLNWKKRQQAITYTYQEDLKKLSPDLDHSLTVVHGQHPILLKLYLGGTISPETLILLNGQVNYFPYWQKEITDPAIWPTNYNKLVKYRPFIQFDKDKIKKITVDYFGL